MFKLWKSTLKLWKWAVKFVRQVLFFTSNLLQRKRREQVREDACFPTVHLGSHTLLAEHTAELPNHSRCLWHPRHCTAGGDAGQQEMPGNFSLGPDHTQLPRVKLLSYLQARIWAEIYTCPASTQLTFSFLQFLFQTLKCVVCWTRSISPIENCGLNF